jgi:hypothetical protein
MNGGKSEMRTRPVDDALLLKYLLGKLSEQEQVQLEDRAFTDADYLASLEGAEADLIDSYVRGELPPAERRDFERRFLASPQRRSKVEFARALTRVIAESTVNQPRVSAPASGWQALLNGLRGLNPVLQFAAAMAVLVCMAAVTWLGVQNAGMRSRMAALENQRRDLQSRERGLQRQLAAEQARDANPATPTPKQQTSEGARGPLLAAMVFVPGLSRAGAPVQKLALDPSVQIARIEIQLEPRDDFPRFRAELRRRNEEVLSQGNLTRRSTNSGYSVFVDVPASTLSTGQYELALKGVAGGQTTDVGFYYFTVQKP